MYLVLGFFLFSGLLYWCYKKFREAPYKPGMVGDAAETEGFDDATLYSKTTADRWYLPGGVELFFFPPSVSSPDKPPVLALHGGPAIAPKNTWKIASQIPNLYLFHARGCGHSSRPHTKFPTPGMWPGIKIMEQELGIGMQVGDVERIRRRLGVGKLDLVGHSFGGFMATLYAAEFPQHVRSLTLLVPATVLVLPSKDGDLFRMVEDKLKERGNEEHVKEFRAFMKQYLDFGSLPKETDATLAMRQAGFAKHYYRAVQGTDDDGQNKPVHPELIGGMACFATFMSMGMEHDYVKPLKERLAHTTFPVAIVHGSNDLIPVTGSQKYIDLFTEGQVEFHTISDADHELFEFAQVADIVNKTIARAT